MRNGIVIIWLVWIAMVECQPFPNQRKVYDDVYDNTSEQKYHHIITALSLVKYVDEYNGIVYNDDLSCKYSSPGSNLSGFYDNLDITNHKPLYERGCIDQVYSNAIPVSHLKQNDNVQFQAIIRFGNPSSLITTYSVSLCSFYYQGGCTSIRSNIISNEVILPRKISKLTMKWTSNKIISVSIDDAEKTGTINVNIPDEMWIQFSMNVCNNGEPDFMSVACYSSSITIHTLLLSVNLLEPLTSLAGNTFGDCTHRGCIHLGYKLGCFRISEEKKTYQCYRYHHIHYPESWSFSKLNVDCSHESCIPGYFCNADDNFCKACDKQCRTCYSNTYNKCKSCYITSRGIQWHHNHEYLEDQVRQCVFEYISLTHFDDFDINIPIPTTYRLTVDMWIFIHNAKNMIDSKLRSSVSSIIIKEFISITIQHKKNSDDITVELIPFEMYYPYTSDIISESEYNVYTNGLQKVSSNVDDVSGQWKFIRCGISYAHNEMHVQYNRKQLKVPTFYKGDTLTNYGVVFRKFYRENEKTKLRMQGFSYVNTEIYVRNLNIFNEYLPPTSHNANYFNLHTITNTLQYPQLIFALPFDDVVIDSEFNTATTTSYDFSNQYSDDNNVITNTEKLIWLRNDLQPPKTFHRMPLLPVGFVYNTPTLSGTTRIACNDALCQNNDDPIACNSDQLLSFNNANECGGQCIYNYITLPFNKIDNANTRKIQNNICVYDCDNGNAFIPQCNSNNIGYYTCNSPNTIPVYYNCLSTNKKLHLHYSGKLNSKSFEITFPSDITNYYIEMWFHPDLLYSTSPPLQTLFLFLTDTYSIYYDFQSSQFIMRIYYNGLETLFPINQQIYYFGWNHLLISSKPTNEYTSTEYSVSFMNSFITLGSVQGNVPIRQVCFCNSDRNCCGYGNDSVDMKWFDVFIKGVNVYNADIINDNVLFENEKIAQYVNSALLHSVTFDVGNGRSNHYIKDIRNSNTKVEFSFDVFKLNPDNDRNVNYGWDFNWNDLNDSNEKFGKLILNTKILNEHTVDIVSWQKCHKACRKCFGYSNYTCYECEENYTLIGTTCKKEEWDKKGKLENYYYYYLNPFQGQDLSLKLPDDLKDWFSFTVFFYLKVFGFTTNNNNNQFTMITFNSYDHLYLGYDAVNDEMNLYIDNKVMFTASNFRTHFGTWIPISIAAFCSDNENLQNNLISMTVGFETLDYKLNEKYPLFTFDKFKLSSEMIAMICEISFYANKFIVNAYGYAQHIGFKDSIEFGVSGENYPTHIIHLRKEKEVKCVDNNDIINGFGFNNQNNIECVGDYLPYTDQPFHKDGEDENKGCFDDEYVQFVAHNSPPKCIKNASKCDAIHQILKQTDNCDYLYSTCDNISKYSINNLLFAYTPASSSKKYIQCGKTSTLDFARYNPGTIPNIESSPLQFKLEFWFLSQRYSNTHFNSFTVEWSFHLTLTVGFDNTNQMFYAQCSALNNPLNALHFNYIESDIVDNKWRYVVCGVNRETHRMILSNLQTENTKTSTSFIDSAPPSTLTSLTFTENSITNYGITYIREMRLWNCSECYSSMGFVAYKKDDIKFHSVLHYFKFDNTEGIIKDYHDKYITGDDNIQVQLTERNSFNGYGVLNEIPTLPNCDESGSLYFNLKHARGCDIMFNFNIFKTDVTFHDVPSSISNRYTIDMWFFIESPIQFQNGFNVIYEDHITLSTFAVSDTDTDITMYCFPQGYRDKLFNKKAQGISKVFDDAVNKYSDVYVNAYSKWLYVRCAYNYDKGKYYMNDLPERDVQPEVFYGIPSNIKNARHLKYFMPNHVKLLINGANDNWTRIFIQTINVYRDYIPQSFNMKYISMKHYAYNPSLSEYSLLMFSVDFQNDYDVVFNKLHYYITDYNFLPKRELTIDNFMTNVFAREYTNYPTYDDFFQCEPGKRYNTLQSTCEPITSPPNCDNKKVFCIDNDIYFWCAKGSYLNINDNKCYSECKDGYTISPDNVEGYGMCDMKGSDRGYDVFPMREEDGMIRGEYHTSFKCGNGNVFVNYNCVDGDKVENSGVYFSEKYKFRNMIGEYAELNMKNYFVDFWVLFENVHGDMYRSTSTDNVDVNEDKYFIFIAYPHLIYRYGNDVYYQNSYTPLEHHVISHIDKYNWNHIVIENYEQYEPRDVFKCIKIYINNEYTVPVIDIKIKNENNFSIGQIAFCHKANSNYSHCNLGLDNSSYKIYSPHWEDAYYKDITLWNWNTTSIQSITLWNSQSPHDKVNTMNIISYHPLTLDTIVHNTLASTTTYKGIQYDITLKSNTIDLYDYSQNVNWFTEFDIAFPNKYITSIHSEYIDNDGNILPYFSLDSTEYAVSECSGNCMKCFGDGVKCISCKEGFILTGVTCIRITGYYFKTPMNNHDVCKHIKLNLPNNIASYSNGITITFYMKFLGTLNKDGNTFLTPIVTFYKDDTNTNCLAWEDNRNTFVIAYNDNYAIEYTNSRNAIGKWSLYSISIANSHYQDIFPHMIVFMVDQMSVRPTEEFSMLKGTIPIQYNVLILSNEVLAYWHDIRIYDKFYVGAYALGQEPYNPYKQKIKPQFQLALKADALGRSCLIESDVDVNESQLGSEDYCIGDDNKYDNVDFYCVNNNNDIYMYRVIDFLKNTFTCDICNTTYCENKCFNNTIKGCLCTHSQNSIYLLRDVIDIYNINTVNSYYCERVSSLNINEYSLITLHNINAGSSSSYMLELWVFIYAYIHNSNFKGVDVIWDQFIGIEIIFKGNDMLTAKCFPYANANDINGNYAYSQYSSVDFNYGEWFFIRCSVDKQYNMISLNNNAVRYTQGFPSFNGNTKLYLNDRTQNNDNVPFGVSFIRELRLWYTKSTTFYDTSHVNLAVGNYDTLLHYFKNYYTTTPQNNKHDLMIDEVTGDRHLLDGKVIGYPYSFINECLTELILCDEGFSYKYNNLTEKYECMEYGSDDIIDNIENDNALYTPLDLLSKSKLMYEMALNDYVINPQWENHYTQYHNSEGTVQASDPELSNTYCSSHGIVKIVDNVLVCYCLGDYIGKYCQLLSTDYQNMDESFTHFIQKAVETYNSYYSTSSQNDKDVIIQAFTFLINGSNLLYTSNTDFINSIIRWLNQHVITQDNISLASCDLNLINMVDSLYTATLTIMNNLKVGIMTNSVTADKLTSRNVGLNPMQEELISENIITIKSMYEYITSLCFIDLDDTNNYFNYLSENVNIELIHKSSSSSFDITSFLQSSHTNTYTPYISIAPCEKTILSKGNGVINLQFITWNTSPFSYKSDIYWNYTSHHVSVNIYNKDIKMINIDSCEEGIDLYLSIRNVDIISPIMDGRFHMTKGNIYRSDSSIFSEPVYIEENGKVSTSTREERIEKYYYEYILVFYYIVNETLVGDNVEYYTIMEDNYLQCKSHHLSDFILNYEYNEFPHKVDGRLFFMKHAKMFFNASNYKRNYGFFMLLFVLFVYGLNMLICSLCLRRKLKKVDNKRYKLIKVFLIDYVFPYGNYEKEFVFKEVNGDKVYNEDEEEEAYNIDSKPHNEKDVLNMNINNNKQRGDDVYSKRLFYNYFNTMADNNDVIDVESINEDKGKGGNGNSSDEEDYKGKEGNDIKTTNANNGKGNERMLSSGGFIKTKKVHVKKSSSSYDNNSSDDNNEIDSDRNNNNKVSKQAKSNVVNAYKNNYVIHENRNFNKRYSSRKKKSIPPSKSNQPNHHSHHNQDSDSQIRHNLQIYNEDMRIKTLQHLSSNPCVFLCINLSHRLIFIYSFRENITYTAPSKSLYLPMYLAILLFTNTFLYLYQPSFTYATLFTIHLSKFILLIFISIAIVSIYFYLKAIVYNITGNDMRQMLLEFKTSKSKFDKRYMKVLKRIKVGYIVETVLFGLIVVVSYIFAFGLCAVYPQEGKCMIFGVLCAFGGDVAIEIIVEFAIMMLFCCRRNQFLVGVLDNVNRMRSFKMLSP